MRPFLLLSLLLFLIPNLLALVVRVPHAESNEYDLLVREIIPSATETSIDASKTSARITPTAGNNFTSTTNSSSPSTTVASLNSSEPSGEDGRNSTAHGVLPIEPKITPALGVSGFLLITLGAILALIGIRNLWIQVFLSSAFLTSLGVTVLIVYVMSPPVRVAIQGAYLVAVFFTGITFGALSIVFKELTEGLGCLLGGFCTSMWLLSTKPGGLLIQTDAKAGFIGAISVGFYALSFSHYTRPYGLIGSTAISGGTAVALGIDCYSRAGLKEFWLYIWALNDDIFPLGTNTYPVTRNIRVELAATVIIAVMGVVSQLRLWKVVRERRQKEKEKSLEEERKKEEAEAEVVRRLEENNIKERMEWEAKYGDPGTGSSSPSIPELADDSRKCPADAVNAMEKGETIEMESIEGSEISYRCTECREMDSTYDSVSETTEATGFGEGEKMEEKPKRVKKKHRKQIPDGGQEIYPKVFDGAAAAKIKDDQMSDVTAIIGSDAVSVRSEEFTRPVKKKAPKNTTQKVVSESREALLAQDDASSMHGVADEGSDIYSDCHTIAAESHDQTDSKSKEPAKDDNHTVNGDKVSQTQEGAKDDNHAVNDEKLPQTQFETKGERSVSDISPPVHSTKQQAASSTTEISAPQNKAGKDASENDKCGTEQAVITEPEYQQIDTEHGTKSKFCADEHEPSQNTLPEEEVIKDNKLPVKDVEDDSSSQPNNDNQTEAKRKKSHKKKAVTKPENTSESGQDQHADDNSAASKNSSEKQPTNPSEEVSQSKVSLKTKKVDNTTSSKRKSLGAAPKLQAKPKKEEPPKLNEDTVKHIPKQTSRVVQSYRTNEWAKHLADAEAPELEPITAFEEELDHTADSEEAAAPVKVTELLQTPLNAQPPPAVEPRTSFGKDASDSRRTSTDSLGQLGSQKKKRTSRSPNRLSEMPHGSTYNLPQSPSPVAQLLPDSVNSSSTTLLANMGSVDPVREESETSKPRWKGPPPLIALREDMVRNRLSSFSLATDPYARQSPAHSPTTDISPRYSSTFTIPEEEEDDMPLSRRRTMLHQQTAPTPPPMTVPPAPSRWNNTGVPSRVNSPAVLAAWRESVREDLKEKQNPLKLPVSHGTTGTMSPDRSPSPFGQMQQRNASSVSIGDKIAESMQRGDMSDLHREAMRRMQAKANHK